MAEPAVKFSFDAHMTDAADTVAGPGARRFGWLLFGVFGLFAAAFFGWAGFSTIDDITRGDGKVIPTGQNKVVQHLEGGIVKAILVKEGDEVQLDQVLMRIDATSSEASLQENLAKYLALMARAARLRAESAGNPRIEFPREVLEKSPAEAERETVAFRNRTEQRKSELSVLEQQVTQREQQLRESRSSIERLRAREANLRLEVAQARRDFNSGVISRSELDELQRTYFETDGMLKTELQAMPRAEAALREAQQKLADKRAATLGEIRKDLNETEAQISALKPQIDRRETTVQRTELRSPTRGVVKTVGVATIGGVVKPGQALIEIVPWEERLIVEVRIKPKDRAFLYKDQKATVKISAYDYAIYGGIDGKVIDISADAIQEERRVPGAKDEPYYRVRVLTAKAFLERDGARLAIIPGMTAQVDISTGRRTVLAQIFEPLYRAASEALSER